MKDVLERLREERKVAFALFATGVVLYAIAYVTAPSIQAAILSWSQGAAP